MPTALQDLAATLIKLRESQEWARLEREERRSDATLSFQPSNHVDDDIKIQCETFLNIAMNVQEVLNDLSVGISPAQRQKWQVRLFRLKSEFRQLGASEIFIKP